MTATSEAPAALDEAGAPRADRFDLLVAAFAALLPLLWWTGAFSWFTTPKAALDLVVLGPGLVALVVLVARRDRAAWAALALVAIAALAGLLADEPLLALVGAYRFPHGWLFLAVVIGAWALGRRLGAGGPRAVGYALVGAAGVNAAVAWLEMSADLGVAGFGTFEGRAPGLMGNPVQLGALCVAAIWLVLDAEHRSDEPAAWLALAALLAGAVQLSGSRVALGLLVVIAVTAVATRLRRGQRTRAAVVALVLAGGVALSLVPGADAPLATDRVTSSGSSGVGGRVAQWRTGIDAVAERPLLGYGPGRYLAASSPRRTRAIAVYEGPDRLYEDAHNVVVEILVGTGILGLAAFGCWLILAARAAHGPLLGFAALVGACMLFSPMYVGLTPLAALALGAAAAARAPGELAFAARSLTVLAVALSLAGALLGVLLLQGDARLAAGVARGDPALVRRSEGLLPWSASPTIESLLAADAARRIDDPEEQAAVRRSARAAARRAIAREPADPLAWSSLGTIEEELGNRRAAGDAYEQALERNPWSFVALAGAYRVALWDGDDRAAQGLRRRLCALGERFCLTPREAFQGFDTVPPALR